MAMERVSEGLGASKWGEIGHFRNTAQMMKIWEEIALRGVQSEEDLNNLKISNLKRLGMLRKEQEKELLDVAINANKKAIDQRIEGLKKAADQEKGKLLAQELAKAKAEKKASGRSKTGKLTKAEEAAITAKVEFEIKKRKDALVKQGEWEKKNKEKELKQEAAAEKRKKQQEAKDYQIEQGTNIFGRGKSLEERAAGLKNIFTGAGKIDKDGNISSSKSANIIGGLNALTSTLASFAQKYEQQMDEIASKKSAIDTRLQGSSNTRRMGSYWDQMTRDITGIAGVSPLVKQSAIADRVVELVGRGISFNVEQRAVLDVVKDKIATTFDAANGTLLRLVKIQQQDTTAGRLGMESALTAFLNNMYETTEYMQTLATTVKGSLAEAMSLMSGENALSFEYQIQKWLGSLSSVGMSDSAVQGLAGVLGQVAAGKLEGITGGGQGNLVIMAANQAGVNMSDILNNGLDETTTNTLMNSMVDYLAKNYNEAGGSKVIQQQIASVYGLSASDLKAAVNLSSSRSAVAKDSLDYSGAMARLYSMAGSMGSRTSLGEQMSNMWDNINYSMAAGMANNPVTYSLFKMSGLLKDVVGSGLDFSIPMVMGSGTTMQFSVPDLMRAGAMAGGIMSSMGAMFSGGGGLTGNSILKGIGISGRGISAVTRGNGAGLSTTGGATVSESGSMVGNSSSDDITNKTMTDQTDSSKQETASAVDESDDTKLSDVDNHVVTIIEILRSISDGNSILKVAIDGDVRISQESITQMGL